jgi:hypothetical protein
VCSSDLEAETLRVSPGGAVTGTAQGTFSAPGAGLIEANLTGGRVFGHVCVSNDVMVFLTREADREQALTILLRAPDSLRTADLAGRWNAAMFVMPDALTRVYYDRQTQTTRHTTALVDWARTNETLADIYLRSPWETEFLALDINAGGAVTGPLAGTVNANPDGTVTFREGSLVDTLVINASKDVMLFAPADDGQAEMDILVKAPAALAVPELAGVWRLSLFRTPSRLMKTYWNQPTGTNRFVDAAAGDSPRPGEQFVDAWFPIPHEVERWHIRIHPDGRVAGLFSGTLSPGGLGAVDFKIEDDTVRFFVNATKTILLNSASDEGEQELVILTRISTNPLLDERALASPIRIDPVGSGQVTFHFVPDDAQTVQQTPALGGMPAWSTVPRSQGVERVTFSTREASAGFLRLLRP